MENRSSVCNVKSEMIIIPLSENFKESVKLVQRLKGTNGFSDQRFNLWNSSNGGNRNK